MLAIFITAFSSGFYSLYSRASHEATSNTARYTSWEVLMRTYLLIFGQINWDDATQSVRYADNDKGLR